MTAQVIRTSGIEALDLATQLLQRARQADRHAGLWEAADMQWWRRQPRQSDGAEKLFWMDVEGPVAAVLVTSWTDDVWQFDPVKVPGASRPNLLELWQQLLKHIEYLTPKNVAVPVADDDQFWRDRVQQVGFSPSHSDSTAWMDATDQPEVLHLPEGFIFTDRDQRRSAPHHMSHRNGHGISTRLEQCSLYDPTLDLAVETLNGQVAAYSLYWFDPITKVGLVEPVRTEDDFQRQGLARAMLTVGIDRLVKQGAERIKVSYETEAAGRLYESVGFRRTSGTTWYGKSFD